jgi:hypothetical protein
MLLSYVRVLYVTTQLDQNLMAKFKTTPQYTAACTEHVNQAGFNSKSVSRHSNYNKSTSRVGSVFSVL